MGDPGFDGSIRLGQAAVAQLMPMHLLLDAGGRVTGVGPTLAKVLAGMPLPGRPFFEVFEMRRPRRVATIADLAAVAGRRLQLAPRGAAGPVLRGTVQPLAEGQGLILNLTFGIGAIAAVRDHALTDADFAPTDLTVELLYLAEAKSAVMAELRRLNQRLSDARAEAEARALTDTLTGLGNRRALDRALDRLTGQGAAFGLMSMDLDYFKQVNDQLGHAAGDHVLRHVAAVLTEETREGDTVVRIGGDEFIVVFAGLTDIGRLTRIAGRVIARLSRPIRYGDGDCRIAASAGLTVARGPGGIDPARLIAEADNALYAAKRAGRGRVVVHGEGPDLRSRAAG